MKRSWGFALGGALTLLALGGPVLLRNSGLRLNYSDSVPVGLYEVQAAGAPYVGLCLSETLLRPALAAGLELDKGGECANGWRPILKTVYRASPERPLELDAEGFRVAGERWRNTMPKAFSKTGKPLMHYAFGTYTSGLWAISRYSADSYDSRYFGPVDRETIRFYAKPVLVF